MKVNKILYNNFPQVKYQKAFDSYIKFIESRYTRVLKDKTLIQRHHIIPVSFWKLGVKNKNNIIKLSLREHYIAHMLLRLSFRGKMSTAFLGRFSGNKFSSRQFEKNYSEIVKNFYDSFKGKDNPRYGLSLLDCWIKKYGEEEALKKYKEEYLPFFRSRLPRGNNHFLYNKTFEEAFGLEKAQEIKQKLSKNHADFSGENNPFFGKNHSEEVKNKLSLNRSGKKWENIYSKEALIIMKKVIKETNKNRIWIYNPMTFESKLTTKEKAKEDLVNGWKKGRKENKIWIVNKYNKSIIIKQDEFKKFSNKGFIKGRKYNE